MLRAETLERIDSGRIQVIDAVQILRAQASGRFASYMPTEPPMWNVTDIDFEKWAAEGVTTLLSDVEACLGETGSEELIPEHVEALERAKRAGIPNLALQTNLRVQSQEERNLLVAWQDQTGADIVLTPLEAKERKPGPYMSYKAMQFFGLDPQADGAQVGVIGDKASADMRAGYFIGAEHRAWTRPFGDQHIGDRLIRGPFEANLRLMAHLALNPKISEATVVINDQPVKLADVIELRPGLADGADRIVGYGIEDITLSDELLATIKRPAFWVALEKIQEITSVYTENPAEKLKEFMYEHGRTTADLLTNSRVVIAAGIIAVSRLDLDMQTKQQINKALIATAYMTDALDGKFARGHKDGATAEGGAKDQDYDKILSNVVDLFVMLPEGSIDRLSAYSSLGRDVLITQLRKPFRTRGIDTKSINSGKISTGIKAGAQIFGLTLGKRYPEANRKIQHAAAFAKVASMAHAPYVWIERHERKLHDQRIGLELIKVIERNASMLDLEA